ncbi:Troponin I [Holothuria leucospilota]|uniref:Troponin I n=1 Tax=Holothuria leucospilota TaxID=206669 RepID=A0A9Q0YJW7_HOLLE|nr:Troponin I [Holothuria leucospilota]
MDPEERARRREERRRKREEERANQNEELDRDLEEIQKRREERRRQRQAAAAETNGPSEETEEEAERRARRERRARERAGLSNDTEHGASSTITPVKNEVKNEEKNEVKENSSVAVDVKPKEEDDSERLRQEEEERREREEAERRRRQEEEKKRRLEQQRKEEEERQKQEEEKRKREEERKRNAEIERQRQEDLKKQEETKNNPHEEAADAPADAPAEKPKKKLNLLGKVSKGRKKEILAMMLKKARGDLQLEEQEAAAERVKYISENVKDFNIDSMNKDQLRKLCEEIHTQLQTAEGEKFDLEIKVKRRDLQISNLKVKANETRGRFTMPTLKQVSKKVDSPKPKETERKDFRGELKKAEPAAAN